MRALIGLCLLLAILIAPVSSFAATALVEWIEPSQSLAGTPIDNLNSIKIYFNIDGGPEQSLIVPASSPAGGQAGSRTLAFPDPPVCGATTVTVFATAINTDGAESERAGPASVTRSVADDPACKALRAPSNLTITIQP